ncbi:MAG: nucleotide exchange factor GrpE [Pseudomonadota bacterium]
MMRNAKQLGACAAAFLSFLIAAAPARPGEARFFDIVLLVNGSRAMDGLDPGALESFAGAIEPGNRTAVLTFGLESRVLDPLEPAGQDEEARNTLSAISRLSFTDDFANLNEGLLLALSEFDERGRKDAVKAVIVLGDGRMNVPSAGSMRDAFLKEIREDILPELIRRGIVLYAVCAGSCNLEFMQELAAKTKGRCLAAPNRAALFDALSIIAAGMKPREDTRAETPPEDPPAIAGIAPPVIFPPIPFPSDAGRASGLVIGVIVGLLIANILAVMFLFARVFRRRAALGPDPVAARAGDGDSPSIAGMRDKMDRITQLLAEAGSRVENFQADLEDFGAERWEKEQKFKDSYRRLTENLVLLCDHLELQARGSTRPDPLERLMKKAGRILEEEGIEEIPVMEGDRFDGMLHKHAGQRGNGKPRGTVLEVVRKGYRVRQPALGDENMILRPAEVIVSSGPS